MKKVISIILSAALLLMLCGCGAGGNESSVPEESTSSAAASGETSAPATEPTATEPVSHFMGMPGKVADAEAVNVRTGPGTKNDIVVRLDEDKEILIFEKTLIDGTYWGRILEGWICLDYVDITPEDLNAVPSTGDALALNGAEHPHEYTSSVTDPACAAKGYTTFTCVCGHSYRGEFVDALGHKWGAWNVVLYPTIYDEGLNQRTCQRCNAVDDQVVPKEYNPHTHQYTPKVTKEPTCSEFGVKTFICSCGKSYTEPVATKAHTYTAQVVAPTCNYSGYTLHTCVFCGHSYSDSMTPASGHVWEHRHQDATNESPAKDWDVCLVCGTVK